MTIPSEQELIQLPPRAIVGFAARCVRRIQPLFNPIWRDSRFNDIRIAFEASVAAAERFSLGHKSPFSETKGVNVLPLWGPGNLGKVMQTLLMAFSAANDANKGNTKLAAQTTETIAKIAYAALAGDAELLEVVELDIPIYETEEEAIASFGKETPPVDLSAIRNTSVARIVKHDFDLLIETAKQSQWSYDSVLPHHFFSFHTEFDKHENLFEITPVVNEKVIEYFRRFPERLYDISPRRFEELIAELFAGFGFNVELTTQTADGGRDVIATSNNTLKLRCLIECKRFAKENKVGLALVQRLHGVVEGEDANKGILVTTSTFTRPAQEFMKKKAWLLEGRDFHGVVEWLDQYQKFQMMRYAEHQYDFIRMLIASSKK